MLTAAKSPLETRLVAKTTRISVPSTTLVRTRRAYFDCKFGQLHVRTAFPTTGGFDEQAPLFCLHPTQGSSRTFGRFLQEIADVRSVYAPDLPGFGESDPSPASTVAEAAGAVSDLANDLRLRQIDLLGLQSGALVALELAAARPELVRRLVLISVPSSQSFPPAKQPALVMRIGSDDLQPPPARSALPHAKFIDVVEYADDLFDAAPKTVAQQVGAFLSKAS